MIVLTSSVYNTFDYANVLDNICLNIFFISLQMHIFTILYIFSLTSYLNIELFFLDFLTICYAPRSDKRFHGRLKIIFRLSFHLFFSYSSKILQKMMLFAKMNFELIFMKGKRYCVYLLFQLECIRNIVFHFVLHQKIILNI